MHPFLLRFSRSGDQLGVAQPAHRIDETDKSGSDRGTSTHPGATSAEKVPNRHVDGTSSDAALAHSLSRLHELRLAALMGGRYDADEFDEAVLAFRRAWEEARRTDTASGQAGTQQAA